MTSERKTYVVITPVRDEAAFIGGTISSLVAQSHRPAHWVIVDDGSTDGTADIIDDATRRHPEWIRVIHLPNRGHRASGSGVVHAFYQGFDSLPVANWDFLAKLDGDLSLDATYFERCLSHFAMDPRLGIGGGTVCRPERGTAVIDSPSDPQFHVRGATKIYRRQCWNDISPLVVAPGWDTIDEVKANRCGWTTRTFADAVAIQHKPTGSAEGRWANSFKNGRANYFTGYHPLFMLAKCLKRLNRIPLGVDSAALLAGYLSAYWKKLPVLADRETVRYLRREQVRRLTMRASIYG